METMYLFDGCNNESRENLRRQRRRHRNNSRGKTLDELDNKRDEWRLDKLSSWLERG